MFVARIGGLTLTSHFLLARRAPALFNLFNQGMGKKSAQEIELAAVALFGPWRDFCNGRGFCGGLEVLWGVTGNAKYLVRTSAVCLVCHL